MLTSNIYYEGELLVGCFTGVIQPQSVFDGMFYQVDSRNIGEVKEGYCQMLYDVDVTAVEANECDVHRFAELNKGIGFHRGIHKTAIVFRDMKLIRLASLYKELAAEYGILVELFPTAEAAFAWLGFDNPDVKIR